MAQGVRFDSGNKTCAKMSYKTCEFRPGTQETTTISVVPAQFCSRQASQAVEVARTGTKLSQLNALHNG